MGTDGQNEGRQSWRGMTVYIIENENRYNT